MLSQHHLKFLETSFQLRFDTTPNDVGLSLALFKFFVQHRFCIAQPFTHLKGIWQCFLAYQQQPLK